MKTISIVATIILLLAAVAFFMRDKSARAELADAEKQIVTLSNQVDSINVRMMVDRTTNTQLNLHISNQLVRVAGLTNRIAKATDDLKRLQQEQATTKTELEKQTKKASDGEVRIAELDSEVRTLRKMLEGREAEIARLQGTIKTTEAELAEYQARVQRAEADVVRLQLDQTDEVALRANLKRLREQWPPNGFAKAPDQPLRMEEKGAKGLTTKVDSKATGYYLAIQPDGSVKLVPPLGSAGSAAMPK